MAEPIELLFFDTFSHENTEELNLDLVQFPKPVFISDVRVIPLGARVQADFPGGVRLGATNPSQFSIEFFVNDLGKPGASTFESLGGLEYNQNGCIHLECGISETLKRQIPTDGLVLRGWYTTITLAVYGTLTRVITEPVVHPPTPVIPPQATVIPPDAQATPPAPVESAWIAPETTNPQAEYPPAPVTYGQPQTYTPTEAYQEYPEYYGNEPPKDPRAYHHPEGEWDGKPRPVETRTEPHTRRGDRVYTRSLSRDREYRDTSRDSAEYEGRRERTDSSEFRDKDWERYGKHQEVCKRGRAHSYDREEGSRKRPRTPPPIGSGKRPHTPHTDVKDLSPGDVESISEEEIGGVDDHVNKFAKNDITKDPDLARTTEDGKSRPDEHKTPLNSPSTQEETALLDVEEFEPILSDEDICDEGEQFTDIDYDYSEYINNDDLIKLFNPFNADVQHFSKISLLTEIKDFLILKPDDEDVTRMENNILEKMDKFFDEKGDRFNKLNELLDLNVNMVESFERKDSGELREEWVQLSDQIPILIENNEVFQFIVDLHLYLSKRSTKDTEFIVNNRNYIKGKLVLLTLLDWVEIGLNFDYALSQPQPGYKIRHIKSGIRLVEAVCKINGTELIVRKDYDAQMKLIELYHKEYMALSIKLMILKSLDCTIWSKHGIDFFISNEKIFNNNILNGYQILIEMIKVNPLVRVKFALNSILNKLNLYEVLKQIKDQIGSFLTSKYLENEYCCTTIPDKEVDDLSLLLQNVCKMYRYGYFELSQPKRFLPVSAQFEINNKDMHDKTIFYKLFEICNFVEHSLILLTHRTCNNLASVTNSILEIISEMYNHHQGLKYLSENIESSNMIIRCLLQSSNNEDDAQFSRAQLIGLELSYKLQSLYHVDSLFHLSIKHQYDYDATEILDQLHAFYCLTFSNVGKCAVAEVLSTSNNLYCLLQFFDVINFDKEDNITNKLKKSPGISYLVDLINTTTVFSTNLSYLERYGLRLLKITNFSDYFEPSTCNKLQEIRLYVKPFELKNIYSYDDITPLCDLIKNSLENVIKLPEGLITCLRIITQLGIPQKSYDSDTLIQYTELKYKYVILQLYSQDGIPNLSSVLQKLCDHYEQPNVHSALFASIQGVIIINIVLPCVLLIRKMITNVITVRNTQFKDLTTIPILLSTFTLINAFPTSAILYQKACQIRQEIIETLLAFTQPVSEEVNENESLSKSLWTQMANEVLKYITSSPFTFIPGLLVFSELLPLPFPILTKLALQETEVLRAVNLRKLWSAHLHSQSANIQDLINTLMASSYQPLLHLLRRVCIQLSDLAANSALMICRGILENAYNNLNGKNPTEPCHGHTARVLNFLASLLTHGAIKCAVMYLLKTNITTVKGDEKFPLLTNLFCDVLRTQSDLSSHLQAQECVVSIIQSLCDSEITLYHNSEIKTDISSDLYLSNALPPKDMVQLFIITMIDHIAAPESSYTTILPIIRTFVLLTEHDYGFYHLHACIEKKSKPFFTVFTKFIKNFSKDNADCLATLSAMLEFLKICLSTDYMEVEPDCMFTPRSSTMSNAMIAASVGWSNVKQEEVEGKEPPPKHPILLLEKMLQDALPEDEALEQLSEDITGLVKSLNTPANDKQDPLVEPMLPVSETLLHQFNGRAVFSITNEITDERMSTAYWLSAPPEENDTEQESIPCDLAEMCRQLLPPEINICRESERICQVSPCSEQAVNDQLKIKRNALDQHRYMAGVDKLKRPFITPMRGRGFLRAPPQRGDPFRSRPPNTSRPPSLHVDDFVALETCGAQPTGPTGYNKLSREIMSVRGTTRSRGRAFVSPDRGSHFRQVGRGASLWPGAHLTESTVVTSMPQHFRVASETSSHFTTVQRTIRGRGIPRVREGMPIVRHVRTFPPRSHQI